MSTKSKQSILRRLKNGETTNIKQSTIDKYNWTDEELKFLKKKIAKDTFEVNKNVTNKNIFTKLEIFDIIDEYVNSIDNKKFKSRINGLLDKFKIKDEIFSKILNLTNEEIIKIIITNYKDPTKYIVIFPWLYEKSDKFKDILTEYRKDFFSLKFKEYKSIITVQNLENRQNESDYINQYNSLFNIEKELSKKEYGSMNHLISVLYTKNLYDNDDIIHINNRNYYDKIKLIDNDKLLNDKENFYNIKTGKMIINDYKTSGIYESYKLELNKYVIKVISKSLELFPRTYLLEKDEEGLFHKDTLSNKIKKIFGYSINDIRKIVESYEINVKKTSRLHMAHVSRHSIISQTVSYLNSDC